MLFLYVFTTVLAIGLGATLFFGILKYLIGGLFVRFMDWTLGFKNDTAGFLVYMCGVWVLAALLIAVLLSVISYFTP